MSTMHTPADTLKKATGTRFDPVGVVITIVLFLLAGAVIFPLFIPWFFVFKTQLEFSYHPWAFPETLRWINFANAWNAIRIDQGLLNTLIVCLGAIATTVPSAALAGYIFARYRNRATEVVFYAILIGYFVPVQMVLIPLYKMTIALRLNDTLHGLFLPMAAFGIPFWCIIYRSFFRTLPAELADAACIDGAGHVQTFSRIMFPLAAPATVLAVLLVFMGAWGDYLLSLVLLNDQSKFTMQLRVASFLNAYGTDQMPRYAAAVIISAAPTIILYLFGNKWIIRGTLAGAVKG